MKKQRYSKRMLAAFERTVRAYERLIADPGGERRRWVLNRCRLCRAVRGCHRCVLGPGWMGCTCGSLRETIYQRGKILRAGTDAEVRAYARARLRAIKAKARRNGVVLS